jgi:chemotaxis protein methyltransferase CheR
MSIKDSDGIAFLQWCLPRLRLSWPGYRKVRRQVYRRIHRRLQTLGLQSLADYESYLNLHSEEWAGLESCCWISISRFYRDKSVFQFLEQEVLPSLAQQILARKEHVLRCWSLGCASGEEAYSLSLIWKLNVQSRFPTVRFVIVATDIDEQALARAQRGCYPFSSLRDLPEGWRKEAFQEVIDGFLIKPEFREPVTFLAQDIRQATPADTFHLILCRYVTFTYFDSASQTHTLRQLVEQLALDGALVVGRNETLPSGEFGLVPWSERERIYRRADRG